MSDSPTIDLPEGLTEHAQLQRMGELVRLAIQRDGACVLLQRAPGEMTLINPRVLQHIPPEAMANELLESWTDEEILAYLTTRGEP